MIGILTAGLFALALWQAIMAIKGDPVEGSEAKDRAKAAGKALVVAAVQHDPQEAVGLSGALAALPQESWGQAILWFIALGLALSGAFCFAEARYRRAT